MRRMFRRTNMETCPADSAFMDCIDKSLIAQIEIVPNTDGHDTVVEHWSTQADKDADLREIEATKEMFHATTGNVHIPTKGADFEHPRGPDAGEP